MCQHRQELNVQCLSRLAKVSRSGYYAFLRSQPCKRELANAHLDQMLSELFQSHAGHAGHRMLQSYLLEAGISASLNRVRRRMRHLRLKARQKRAFKVTTDSRHTLGYAHNILAQNFIVDHPNQAWVGDITYLKTGATWFYLATVIDLYARRVVGWTLDTHMKSDLICNAFEMAKQNALTNHLRTYIMPDHPCLLTSSCSTTQNGITLLMATYPLKKRRLYTSNLICLIINSDV